MSKSEDIRPPVRKIGARVRIKLVHDKEVEALFQEAGVLPIYKELRTDGNVSYWFGRDQLERLADAGVLERIPLQWWAHHAVVGSPPTIN